MLLKRRFFKCTSANPNNLFVAYVYPGIKLEFFVNKKRNFSLKNPQLIAPVNNSGGKNRYATISIDMDTEKTKVPKYIKNIEASHALLTEVKTDDKSNKLWNLVILLFSKSAAENEYNTKELDKQLAVLAKLTDMLKRSNFVHKSLVNINPNNRENPPKGAVYRNKISLLAGDFLLATAINLVATLKNQHISSLIFAAIRDLSEAEFVGERDAQNLPLPTNPKRKNMVNFKATDVWTDPQSGPLNTEEAMGYAADEWIVRNVLGGASLLGRACEAVLVLRGYSTETQKQGYYFGCYLALSFCASEELLTFRSTASSYSLVSAPVLFALENHPPLYDYISTKATIDYEYLRRAIADSKSLEKSEHLCADFTEKALEIMSKILLKSDASITLEKLILSANTMS